MSILHSPRRGWTASGKISFFGINHQFQFILGFWERRVWTFNKKRSAFSKLHLTCPEAKLDEKMFFFGIFTILNICSDCDGNTFESSAKKFLVDSPNCLVLIQKKDSNEVTLFRTFQFQIVSQTLSGKYPAVLSKTNCTSPEEPMKNEVLIWNNLIPKKVFAIWRRSFG